MKRRTRLRKQGLPPDPPKPLRTDPAAAEVQLYLDLHAALHKDGLSTQLATDLNVREDCRRYGIRQVVLSIRSFGDIPSNVLWRAGDHPLQRSFK